jgi:hypothetical protein
MKGKKGGSGDAQSSWLVTFLIIGKSVDKLADIVSLSAGPLAIL